jgi:diadenosine tetraphosphate (Ap4A) HIT family hydrolase/glutathione S-transferase
MKYYIMLQCSYLLRVIFLILPVFPTRTTQYRHASESILVVLVSAFTTTTTTTTTTSPWSRKKYAPTASALTALSSSDNTIPTTTDQSSSTSSIMPVQPNKGILYDTPVSNHGARCRLILYKKGIGSDEVLIQPPSVLGGLTSEVYQSFNPEGKMPLFVCTHNTNHDMTHIFESDTISRYLLHEYEPISPSFQPNHVRSNLMVRIHDMYISTIQGCLYKAKPPFGIHGTRIDALQELMRQLRIIEDLMVGPPNVENGPYYLCGNDVSLADATIYPTMVFVSYMLPKFDMEVPKKLDDWYNQITKYDADFLKVQQEIHGTLQVWETTNHRWDTIFGAGWRDVEPTTLFDQIIAGTIPATIVDQADDKVLAFRDIQPAAPAHVLLIPKQRYGLTQLSKATLEHTEILGRLLVAAASIARDESIGFGPNGCRIVINDGPDGGQEVMHLHVHLLGGRPMSWPPG